LCTQKKSIFSQDGRFNASTNVFNEIGRFTKFSETINRNKVNSMRIFPNNEIYVKLDDNSNTINRSTFCFNKVSTIYDLYDYSTMIVTYKKGNGLENDTDDDKYQTPRPYHSKILNYESSVIKTRSYASGHFKEGNLTINDSYTYNLKDFDMLKTVIDEQAHLGLTNKKELSICQATD